METTRLSSKGQIVLPKKIRISKAWGPGTEFAVEETSRGILLRPSRRFPPTELKDVSGCLRSKRGSIGPKQVRDAISREVMRRHDSGRY